MANFARMKLKQICSHKFHRKTWKRLIHAINIYQYLSISINIYQYVGSQKFHPETSVHLGLQLQTVLALNHGILVLPCRFYSRLLGSDSPLKERTGGRPGRSDEVA